MDRTTLPRPAACWRPVVSAAAVALGLAACATPPLTEEQKAERAQAAAREDCMFSSTISDWADLDRERLIVYAPSRTRPYLVELTMPSSDLPFNVAIGVLDGDGNGRICGYGFDAILIPGHIPDRILIRSVQRLTPDEAKKLMKEAQERRKQRRPAPPVPPASPSPPAAPAPEAGKGG